MSKILFVAFVVVTALALFAPPASAEACPHSCGPGLAGSGPTSVGLDPTQNPCRPTCGSMGDG